MTNEIKEILQLIGSCCYYGKISEVECEKYRNYITNLQKTQKTLIKNDNEIITNLQEENERLKDLYRRTIEHLFKIGNDELARYFQAQINDCPSFVPQDIRGDE